MADRIETFQEGDYMNRSEAVRKLIRDGLDANEPLGEPDPDDGPDPDDEPDLEGKVGHAMSFNPRARRFGGTLTALAVLFLAGSYVAPSTITPATLATTFGAFLGGTTGVHLAYIDE